MIWSSGVLVSSFPLANALNFKNVRLSLDGYLMTSQQSLKCQIKFKKILFERDKLHEKHFINLSNLVVDYSLKFINDFTMIIINGLSSFQTSLLVFLKLQQQIIVIKLTINNMHHYITWLSNCWNARIVPRIWESCT